MIVGIDPGLTTGISVLDMKGNVLAVTSKRFLKNKEIINFICSFGTPVVIASDVNPMPKGLKKFARALGCKIYFPPVSLTSEEKKKLSQKWKERIIGIHKRDALAAGIKAYKSFHELLKKVEDELRKIGREDLFEEVTHKIFREGTENIKTAIKSVMGEEKIKSK